MLSAEQIGVSHGFVLLAGFAFGNAVRWGTAYTFRFDADYPPSDANSVLGLWRPGPQGDQIDVGVMAPTPDCTGDCPGDLNGDGLVGVNDVLDLIAAWGGPDGDIDGDGSTNVNDLLQLIELYGNEC